MELKDITDETLIYHAKEAGGRYVDELIRRGKLQLTTANARIEELQTVRTLRDETIERLDQEIERLTGGGADALKAYLNGVAYRERIEELGAELARSRKALKDESRDALEVYKRLSTECEHQKGVARGANEKHAMAHVVIESLTAELTQAQKKVTDLLKYVEMVRGDLEQAGKELTQAHETMRESLSWGDISKSRDVLQDYLEALPNTASFKEHLERVAERVKRMPKWKRDVITGREKPHTPKQPTEVVADVECKMCGDTKEIIVPRDRWPKKRPCPDCTGVKPTEENTNG